MKYAFLTILLSVTFVAKGQDSLLNKAWLKLAAQLKNRIQVVENFGTFTLASKSVDTLTVSYLKEVSHSLKERLDTAVIPARASIDSIKAYNLLFIGALSKILVLIEQDLDFLKKDEFKNYLTSLMGAENRIAVASREFNEVCKKVNRDDLMY